MARLGRSRIGDPAQSPALRQRATLGTRTPFSPYTRAAHLGKDPRVSQYECELVLRENDHENRVPHSFSSEVKPGTFVRHGDRDWIVIEVQEGELPSVVCRPAIEY
jgi:hypothetical protein